MKIYLSETNAIDCDFCKGQYHINLSIVCEGSIDGDFISFIYDTGAYITVLSRETYMYYKLDKLPKSDMVYVHGYGDKRESNVSKVKPGVPGYVFTIPAIKIGRIYRKEVKAFTPVDDELKQNLLGANVIEYYNVYQDNCSNKIYFMENSTPEPYKSKEGISLACGEAFAISNER